MRGGLPGVRGLGSRWLTWSIGSGWEVPYLEQWVCLAGTLPGVVGLGRRWFSMSQTVSSVKQTVQCCKNPGSSLSKNI